MKKRIIIGDPHGRYGYVKDIYAYEDPDEVILLGDYFDSWDIWPADQKTSYEGILELRQAHHEKGRGPWVMLLGNHDAHYLPAWPNGKCSGWSGETEAFAGPLLSKGMDDGTLRIAWVDTDIKTIYTHAGVTEPWASRWLSGSLGNLETVAYEAFQFVGADPYGDDSRNSPLWVRPSSLLANPWEDTEGHLWDQVFGHTESIAPAGWLRKGRDGQEAEFWCMDCIGKFYLRESIDGNLVTREVIDTFTHEVVPEDTDGYWRIGL